MFTAHFDFIETPIRGEAVQRKYTVGTVVSTDPSHGNPEPLEAADSCFWSSRRDVLVSVSCVKCTGESFAWLSNNEQFSHDLPSGPRLQYYLEYNSRSKSLRRLRRCLYTARGASARCVNRNGSTMLWFLTVSDMSLTVGRR